MARRYILFMFAIILIAVSATASTLSYAESDSGAVEPVRVAIATYPSGQPVIVDGVIYFPIGSSPIFFEWLPGSIHTVEVLVDTWYADEGVRYVFKTWNLGSDSSKIEVEAAEGLSVIALYERQYFVEIYSPYGNPSGMGWYPAGSIASISVEGTVELDDGVRAVFQRWSEGSEPSNPETFVYVFEPKKLSAQWKIEYLVQVDSELEGAPVSGGGWYEQGSKVTVTATTEYGGDEVVWRFSGWRIVSGNVEAGDLASPTLGFRIYSPVVVEALYDRYYLVEAYNPVGEVEGTGYYKEGSLAVITVPDVINAGEGTRYRFQSWTGSVEGNSPRLVVEVDGPIKVVANWKLQFYLNAESSEPAVQSVGGDGWYDEGSRAKISAAPQASGRYGVKYVFAGWSGDYNGNRTSASIIMDSPKEVEAIYVKDYTGFYLNLGAIIVSSALIYFGYTSLLPRVLKRFRQDIGAEHSA